MALDEYGREPGVDYSDHTWTVHGLSTKCGTTSRRITEVTATQLDEILSDVNNGESVEAAAAMVVDGVVYGQ